MSYKSKIEWCEATWSPIVGCSKVSAGCKNCFAERMAKRQRGMGTAKYQTVVDEKGWTGEVALCSNKELYAPLHWKEPRMIFVDSMSDLFYEKVPRHWIHEVYGIITHELAQQHIFQVLTKRPDIMRDYHKDRREVITNLWLGTTVENPDYLHRIKDLIEIPAAKHFVSFEPLLDFVDFGEILNLECQGKEYKDSFGKIWHKRARGYDLLNWIIIGCETGPGARKCETEWVRDLARQGAAVGLPVLIKKIPVNGKPTGDIKLWPPDLRKFRQMPER